MAEVTIQVDGRVVRCESGRKLFDVLMDATCVIQTVCGGKGVCTLCHVLIEDGAPEPSPREQKTISASDLARGVRLACRVVVNGPMRVISRSL